MSWQPRVFARENAALVGHELPQQVGVLKIEGIYREVDLRFGARSAHLRHSGASTATTAVGFFGAGFARHRLLDFTMQRVAPQSGIVFS